MKRKLLFLAWTFTGLQVLGQPKQDTTGDLVAQADTVIKSTTVIKIENLGFRVNSELP